MDTSLTILKVAIQTPIRQIFDYLPNSDTAIDALLPGVRVKVPFGKRSTIGIIVGFDTSSKLAKEKLKTITSVIDTQPIYTSALLALAEFASAYYQHPIGEILLGSLPTLLREGQPAVLTEEAVFRLTEQGATANLQQIKHAIHQLKVIQLLKENPSGLTRTELASENVPSNAITALLGKGFIKKYSVTSVQTHSVQRSGLLLNNHQQQALDSITQAKGFQPFLLEGITGSGKTEVYLRAIEHCINENKQALILVPEIGLTPQTVARFQARFSVPITVLHSSLTEKERMQAWLIARMGKARIIIGTRSAILTPLPELGIIILDEEHDLSFKQQAGFRYSAKDLAIVRAKLESVPVVLGSATPSLETLYNTKQKRFKHLYLPQRAGGAIEPKFYILDIRNKKMNQGLSPVLLQRMQQHLDNKGQILLFLNRRGYAPTMICHECGWIANCTRCDARYTYHQQLDQLLCHHCGSQHKLFQRCPSCHSSQLLLLGIGTERVEKLLAQHFPDIPAIRIDRDSTRRKGSMEKILKSIYNGQSRILVGTQMLAKGHHFPDVTMVAIVDVDSSLYSADFRAAERLGQTVIQVAGRAGRSEKPGEVYIQTHHPDHPLLLQLVSKGYSQFAEDLLRERRSASLPPYTYLALFRAEATQLETPQQFLIEVKKLFTSLKNNIEVLGPIPALMERKAGKYRAQLMLQTKKRTYLQKMLPDILEQIETLPLRRNVRWSLDVDPLEIF